MFICFDDSETYLYYFQTENEEDMDEQQETGTPHSWELLSV